MRALIPYVTAILLPAPASGSQEAQRGSWLTGDAWELREDLRIGSLEQGPDQFGAIGSLAVDSGGRIVVLETLEQELRVFEPDGTLAYVVGGGGAGPGEFQGAADVSLGPNQSVWLTDPILNRYTGFSRDGELLRTVPRQILGYSAPGGFLRDSSFIDWAVSFPDEGPGVVAGSRVVLHPIRMSPAFEPVDTLPPFTFQQDMVPELGIPQVFFKPRPQLFVARDGTIWFSGTVGYEINRRNLGGTADARIVLRQEPAPVTSADREFITETYRRRPELLSAYLEALPATKPMIHRITGDGAGHIYVVPETRETPAGASLDVFRESGQYLGRLELPSPIGRVGVLSLDPLFVTRDHVYYVVRDEFDVPYVSRLVIIRP